MHPRVRKNSLVMLWALSRRLARIAGIDVSDLYRWCVVALAALYAIFLVFFALNTFGYLKAVLVLTVLATGFIPVALIAPRIFFSVVTFGVLYRMLGGSSSLREGVEKLLRLTYLKVFLFPHMWIVSGGLLLGTIPLSGSTISFWLVAAAAILIGVYILVWPDVFKGHAGKKLVFTYAVGVIAYALVIIIPAEYSIKYLHWDPASLAYNAVDTALLKFERADKSAKDKGTAASLNILAEKRAAGLQLSPEESAFVAAVRDKKEAASAKAAESSGGTVTITAPATGVSRGVKINLGYGNCLPQGEVLVKTSNPVQMVVDGKLETVTEYKDGPLYSNHFGELPKGITFWYQSRTGGNIEVVCHNVIFT